MKLDKQAMSLKVLVRSKCLGSPELFVEIEGGYGREWGVDTSSSRNNLLHPWATQQQCDVSLSSGPAYVLHEPCPRIIAYMGPELPHTPWVRFRVYANCYNASSVLYSFFFIAISVNVNLLEAVPDFLAGMSLYPHARHECIPHLSAFLSFFVVCVFYRGLHCQLHYVKIFLFL